MREYAASSRERRSASNHHSPEYDLFVRPTTRRKSFGPRNCSRRTAPPRPERTSATFFFASACGVFPSFFSATTLCGKLRICRQSFSISSQIVGISSLRVLTKKLSERPLSKICRPGILHPDARRELDHYEP